MIALEGSSMDFDTISTLSERFLCYAEAKQAAALCGERGGAVKITPVRHPNQTLALWIFMGYAVYVLAGLGFTVMSFAGALVGLTDADRFQSAGHWYELTLFGIVGAIVGWSVGVLQKLVLETRLDWDADGWLTTSILGGALGGITVFGVALLRFNLPHLPSEGVAHFMPIFIVPVALCQWWVLRRVVAQAYWWVFANWVAGVTYALIPSVLHGLPLLATLMSPFAQAALTGMMLIFLFERFRRGTTASSPTPNFWP
jgi:hypothetical protein